jgi:hydrogenase maturation protease
VKTLVIGYGNDSRRDDGVGRYVIEQLAARPLTNADLEVAHQLEVELAETLTGYQRVIFVDAAIPEQPEAVRRSVVRPGLQSHAVAHYLTPADVLALCQTLYGHQPEALLFSIRGENFHFGTELSPAVAAAGRDVARQIADLLGAPQPQEQPAHA